MGPYCPCGRLVTYRGKKCKDPVHVIARGEGWKVVRDGRQVRVVLPNSAWRD